MHMPAASHATQQHAYTVVDTIEDIAATIQSLTSVDQSGTPAATRLALVSISLHFKKDLQTTQAFFQKQADQSARYFLDNLRSLVRRTDVVLLMKHSFYFLLLEADEHGGALVRERLWESLLWRVHNASDDDVLRPHSMEIGCGAYPSPHKHALKCIAAARDPELSFSFSPAEAATQQNEHSNELPCYDELSELVAPLPVLARRAGIPYLSLLPRTLPTRLRQLINPQLALELQCFPLGRERNTLTVAIANPSDRRALDRLHQETGLHIFPVLAPPHELAIALEELV